VEEKGVILDIIGFNSRIEPMMKKLLREAIETIDTWDPLLPNKDPIHLWSAAKLVLLELRGKQGEK
jgi:hypothetical protein